MLYFKVNVSETSCEYKNACESLGYTSKYDIAKPK